MGTLAAPTHGKNAWIGRRHRACDGRARMGLDATVMCTCYAEGRTTPPPVAPSLVHVDDDGYLALRGGYGDSEAMDLRFEAWLRTACAHEDMDHATEHIANWTGYRLFQQALADAGWERFPVLREELPERNGGFTSAAQAERGLVELQHFRGMGRLPERWALVDSESGEPVQVPVRAYEGVFMLSGSDRLEFGVAPHVFFIQSTDGVRLFEARRFGQEISNESATSTSGVVVRYSDLESAARFECRSAVSGEPIPWPDGRMQDDDHRFRFRYPRRLHVAAQIQTADDFEYVLGPLDRIFRAAVETGNPVRWC
jgi:hypothetical protein